MRTTEPFSMHQAYQQFVEQSPHQSKLAEAAIICAWKDLMPLAITRRTEKIFVHNHQLFLKVSSAPLRQEIQTSKKQLLAQLQKAVPRYGLKDIVWL